MAHLGVHTEGAMTPHSKLVEIFVQCTYPQFSSLQGSYRVDKQTLKQTDAGENIHCSSVRYDIG